MTQDILPEDTQTEAYITPQQRFVAYVQQALPQAVAAHETVRGELALRTTHEWLERLLVFLRDDAECRYTMLMDICAVDYPERPERLEVVYHLLSITRNQRLRVKLATDASAPVPTATTVYPTANWFEREAWDMYGVLFDGHPDLRRILTDYGFDGHPQRKDFPLTGYVEMRYDVEQKRVIYEPVKLNQAYRSFDFLSPWEGGYYEKLPGDEKAFSEF